MLGYKIYNYQLHAYSVARDQFYERGLGALKMGFPFELTIALSTRKLRLFTIFCKIIIIIIKHKIPQMW